MKNIIRYITAKLYKHVLKPLLFKRHPDKVHSDIVRLGKFVQSTFIIRALPGIWAEPTKSNLQITLAGVHFPNPVGLSAGFDKNIELAGLIKAVGFGFLTGGSVTAEPCNGNQRPWFHRLVNSKSLVVNAGLPNNGVDTITRTIDKYPRDLFVGFPLVVSVAKTNSEDTTVDAVAIDDYCASLKRLEKTRHIAMYEINISCPNTFGGQPFTTPRKLEKLLKRIDELELSRPITIKLPIGLPDRQATALLDVIVKHQVSGVTIGNLLKDRQATKLSDELSVEIPGGLSGLPTRDISTELIRKTYAKYGDKLFIIGVGGVFSAESAYEKIRAGASLIGLMTGMIFEGPQVIGQINHDLSKLLARDGYSNISEAIGASTR